MNLKIITSNIRYDDPKDGPNQWCFRQKIWTGCINSFTPHILGTQEGLHPQMSVPTQKRPHHSYCMAAS
ncbi:MAG: endonuclease, partial [Bdellovibrionota bacterium]